MFRVPHGSHRLIPRTRLLPALCALLCSSALSAALAANLQILDLRCEYVREPLGVDLETPRLFWRLDSTRPGTQQSAYQILAASSPKLIAQEKPDLWDSGKVRSDDTVQIAYAGKPLRSAQCVFWKVRAWDENDKASSWSQTASWTMGVLKETDWQAQWIGEVASRSPDPQIAKSESQTILLRKAFAVKTGLRRALVFVCGLGCYEMSLNGSKVGDALFPPGWTKYDKTCLYDTYEITSSLQPGANAVGLLLGNGMYNVVGGRYTKFTGSFGPLKAIAQLVLEYSDGTVEIVGTDDTWRVAPGPITFSCIYGGEDYDAQLERPGWDRPGCDDSSWKSAKAVSGPGGKLRGLSCAAPPIRAFEILKPVQVTEPRPGTWVYDLGQNVSLMPRLRVKGAPGAKVKITPAELLGKDGQVDRGSCGGGAAYWQYTLAGRPAETWFPKFYYHGSRYLQVDCTPAADGELPEVEQLEALVVHSAAEPVGQFECSNELFNRIHKLVRWAQRSNMMSVMTDCPHREKLGWLEEDHLNGPSLRYEFNLAQLFTKAMNDMADSQLQNGLVPDIAPEYVKFDGGFRDSPEWGSAFILVAWQQYEFTGDIDLLRRYYHAMERYVAYLGSRAKDHIVSHGLGDWYDIGPKPPGIAQLTPLPLTATAFYYYDTWILSQAAQLLGKGQDAARYKQLAQDIATAFNQQFFKTAEGQYATGSQCANSIPLVMDLVPKESRQAVLNRIVEDIRQRGNALTAGDVGYRYLLRALLEGGRSDVIFDVNNQSEKPGYGYQLKQGATSLTEAWDSGRNSSQNHFMLGQITEWFYCGVAGINCDPSGPGFKHILIKPAVVGDLKWVKAKYDSVRGPISSAWEKRPNAFRLEVAIPVGTTASVYVPAALTSEVRVNGRPASRAPIASFVRKEENYSVFRVGSGRYTFESRTGS